MVSPAAAEAESVTVPVPHLAPPTGAEGTAGNAFTVAITGTLVAETHNVVVLRAWA